MQKLVGSLLFVAIVIGVALEMPRARGGEVTAASPALPTVASTPVAIAPSFDQKRAWDDLVYQVKAGFRVPGTPTHRAVRDWLVRQLAACVRDVQLQPFTMHANGKAIAMWNILAVFPAADPAVHERVLLCAHWDSRPISEYDSIPANRVLPIPGANDGASGVAVLLEIARQLKAHPVARTVEIALFDGEDYAWPGEDLTHVLDDMLLGSGYFAAHMGKEKPDWGILLDMIGAKNLNIYREPNSEINAKAIDDRVFRAAHNLGFMGSPGVLGFYDDLLKDDAGNLMSIDDDHTALNKAGIPTADIIDFHYPVWHTQQDDIDHCSADSLGIVGRTILYTIAQPGK